MFGPDLLGLVNVEVLIVEGVDALTRAVIVGGSEVVVGKGGKVVDGGCCGWTRWVAADAEDAEKRLTEVT